MTATANPAANSARATSAIGALPNYGFVIDNRRCIGCHACTVACKAEHQDPIGINKTWVSYIEKGVFPDVAREFHVMRCNHCADAPCVEICPTACLITRHDGIVDFDPARCIGCKACMQACPYDAITIHPDSNTATKCNYCSHRVEAGREPACVIVCPAEAIIAGDLADPTSKIARLVAREDVSVRKPEKGTRPKLYYVEGDAAALSPSATRMSHNTLWGSKPVDGLLSTVAALPRGDDAHLFDIARAARQAAAVSNGADPSAAAARAALEERARPRRTYDIAQRHAATWGWKVSAYLFTKSIAAGMFLIPALFLFQEYFYPGPEDMSPLRSLQARARGLDVASLSRNFEIGAIGALIALAVTGALLVADLKRPERFIWVLLRPQWRSWLVRGAYIIAGYTLLLAAWWLLDPDIRTPGTLALAGLTALFAAGTASYSGWLFGQAKGRDLWQSSLAPLHLLVQALVAGAAMFLCLPHREFRDTLVPLLITLLASNALLVVLDVWGKHATADAARAAHMMRTGKRGLLLFGGVFLAGHLLPILFMYRMSSAGDALAGLLALLGVLIYEHLWVETPQRIPLA